MTEPHGPDGGGLTFRRDYSADRRFRLDMVDEGGCDSDPSITVEGGARHLSSERSRRMYQKDSRVRDTQ